MLLTPPRSPYKTRSSRLRPSPPPQAELHSPPAKPFASPNSSNVSTHSRQRAVLYSTTRVASDAAATADEFDNRLSALGELSREECSKPVDECWEAYRPDESDTRNRVRPARQRGSGRYARAHRSHR